MDDASNFAPTPEGWVGPKWPPTPGDEPHAHKYGRFTGDFETGNRYAHCVVRGCKHKIPMEDTTWIC